MHAATRRAQRAEQETSHSPRSVIMTTAKVASRPQLRRGVASEEAALAARHRRNSQMDRLDLCTQLQQFDVWSAQYVADTSKELMQDLGEPADRLVPLFAELFAAKDLSTKYTERRVSLGTQEQLANHAAYFLRDSIAAIDKQVESQGVQPLAHFEKLGFGPARIDPARAEKLKQRFEGQIEECMDEEDYAAVDPRRPRAGDRPYARHRGGRRGEAGRPREGLTMCCAGCGRQMTRRTRRPQRQRLPALAARVS